MSLLPTSIDYTDRDFDSVRSRLFALIQSAFPDWSDFDADGVRKKATSQQVKLNPQQMERMAHTGFSALMAKLKTMPAGLANIKLGRNKFGDGLKRVKETLSQIMSKVGVNLSSKQKQQVQLMIATKFVAHRYVTPGGHRATGDNFDCTTLTTAIHAQSMYVAGLGSKIAMLLSSPADTVNAAQWHHLAVVRAEDVLRLFVDVLELDAVGVAGLSYPDLAGDLTIGAASAGGVPALFFQGYIMVW